MEKQSPRRMASREVSSRFLSDARSHSPSRRRQPHRSSTDDSAVRRLWPSAAKKNTLADHLGNERLVDLANPPPPPIARQRSCSELRRLDGDEKEHKGKNQRGSKENHRPVLGGSMRYIGKFRFPRSPKPGPASSPPTSPSLNAARISIDENALAGLRKSVFASDFPNSESERSEQNKYPTPRPAKDAKSAEWNPAAKIVAAAAIRRSSSISPSYGSSATQWALSPGRRSASPPMADSGARPAAVGLRSFSSLRPPSPPGKGRRVGNFISMGLDLIRRKSFYGSSSPSSSLGFGVAGSPTGSGTAAHQFRMMHNRLIQWRYVNARSDAVNSVRLANTEMELMGAWVAASALQASVVQRRLQLEKQKLSLKLNTLLSSQMEPLEAWADLERQHMCALSTTKDCLQAAVSRIPLIEAAKADQQPLSAALRQANDLVSTITSTISMFNPVAEKRVPLLSELAQLVTTEKFLLQECFELMSLFSTLQIREQSLKCHLMQVKSLQNARQLETKDITISC